MKDLINFKSSDIKIGQKLDKKILDARIGIKFKARGRVSLEEYEVGIRSLPTDLRREVNKVVDIVIEAVEQALDSAMESAIWNWADKDVRDIVDTGALKESLSITKAGNGFSIKYDQIYAAMVHYGGYIEHPYGNRYAGKFYYTPRPWVESVLNGGITGPGIDFEAIFEEAFARVTAKYDR